MAHKGKQYQIEQRLRTYNLTEDHPFWIPAQVRCTVQTWGSSGVLVPPPTPTIGVAELFSGGPPSYSVEYRTPDIGPGGYTLELGFIRKVLANRFQCATVFQVWVNGVAQLNDTNAPWIATWIFDALVDRGHLAGADLWPSPISPLLEAILWP